jgi:AraC-like DNA-binding protein
MRSNTVIISGCLTGARELITELGGDAPGVIAAAGFAERLFDEPDLFVSAAQVVDFFELAARECGRPDFGLLHAHRLPLATIGHGWMIMRAAETVGDAVLDFVHLYGLYTDAGTLRAERQAEGLWVEYSFLPVGRFGEAQIIALTLGCICLFIRESLVYRWRPARTCLSATPEDPRPFVEFFGAEVKFGEERDAILIDNQALNARMGHGSVRRELHRSMMTYAGRGPAIVAQVKALLNALLRHEHCSIETIGAALGISGRTVQRRLTAAGTSYRELLDDVRADVAWRHAKRTKLHFAFVADLLGYESPAAFSRAFRRWYGMSPQCARTSAAEQRRVDKV